MVSCDERGGWWVVGGAALVGLLTVSARFAGGWFSGGCLAGNMFYGSIAFRHCREKSRNLSRRDLEIAFGTLRMPTRNEAAQKACLHGLLPPENDDLTDIRPKRIPGGFLRCTGEHNIAFGTEGHETRE